VTQNQTAISSAR